ncbi:NADAR family protein [Gimesia chilikensis]|uniref:NADAR family protein n=1 Tax=Gimesia chilikensis TaxID=2605989 RepID=UPI0011EDB443|nr:NADAR family protein [Gimesia chilikensis]KAA0139087.1 NADAR family protein [Gimesia chilikensis]
MAIYFYTRNDKYGAFSNFSPHGVEMDGLWWPSVEHYFQAQKFSDPEYRERIRTAHNSKQAALLGRSRKVKLRDDWETVKEDVMSAAVLKKFQTHLELKALLLSTGDEAIVENAPGDYFWGCGQDGTGLNRLGMILEQVRDVLRQGLNSDQK